MNDVLFKGMTSAIRKPSVTRMGNRPRLKAEVPDHLGLGRPVRRPSFRRMSVSQ